MYMISMYSEVTSLFKIFCLKYSIFILLEWVTDSLCALPLSPRW